MPASSLGWEGPAAGVPASLCLSFHAMCLQRTILFFRECATTQEHTLEPVRLARCPTRGPWAPACLPREAGSWQPVPSAGQVSLRWLSLSAFAAPQLVFLECLLEWGLLHRGLPSGSVPSGGRGPPNSMPSSVKKGRGRPKVWRGRDLHAPPPNGERLPCKSDFRVYTKPAINMHQ